MTPFSAEDTGSLDLVFWGSDSMGESEQQSSCSSRKRLSYIVFIAQKEGFSLSLRPCKLNSNLSWSFSDRVQVQMFLCCRPLRQLKSAKSKKTHFSLFFTTVVPARDTSVGFLHSKHFYATCTKNVSLFIRSNVMYNLSSNTVPFSNLSK